MRAQLDHALIDVDILHKPKTVAMMHRFGDISGLAYLELIFQISRATKAEVEVDTAYAVAKRFGISDPDSWLAYCIDREMLSRTDGGNLTQERVAKDQEALAKKRKRWRDEKQDSVPESIPESGETKVRNPPDSVNTEDLKDLNLKKTVFESDPLRIPDEQFADFNTPAVHATVAAWKAYLQTRHGRHFGQQQLDALLGLYGTRGPEALIAALRNSQANGWKSAIDPPERNGRTTDPPKSFQTQMLDRSLEALKEKEAKGLL